MSDHDLEQLLGGFAADTLTPEEKDRLYSAALHDQQLFDALADEQALKELLADPAVRRRLLHTLNQAGTSGTALWIDWLRRPSGLAWAGGLAAAVVAVVLGTKIYQDSLKHTAQSVKTEETRPAAPAVQAPSLPQPGSSSIPDLPAKTKSHEAPAKIAAKKDASLDQVMKREQAAVPASREQRAADSVAGLKKRHRGQEEPGSKSETFLSEDGKTSTSASPSAVQKSSHDAPAASVPTTDYMRTPSGAVEPAGTAPTVSARARFFGEVPSGTALSAIAAEQERPMRSAAESAPQTRMQDRIDVPSSQLGLATEAKGPAKPLGLRHSFMIQGSDGRNREVSATAVSEQSGPILLTVESNQEAYVQVWITTDSRPPQLLLPVKVSPKTALKLFVGQRQTVFIPTPSEPTTIIARISRIPLGPTIEQDPSFRTHPDLHLLQETVTAIAGTPQQEEATYTVNQDASLNQLTVSFPFPSP